MTNRDTIIDDWFIKYAIPTQEQYKEVWESYTHRDDIKEGSNVQITVGREEDDLDITISVPSDGLVTMDKTIVGAINEISNKIDENITSVIICNDINISPIGGIITVYGNSGYSVIYPNSTARPKFGDKVFNKRGQEFRITEVNTANPPSFQAVNVSQVLSNYTTKKTLTFDTNLNIGDTFQILSTDLPPNFGTYRGGELLIDSNNSVAVIKTDYVNDASLQLVLLLKQEDLSNLITTDKTLVGAINEISNKADGTQSQLNDYQNETSNTIIDLENNINNNTQNIDSIKELVPPQATPDNQLADKAFVNSTVENMAANRVFYDASKGNFPTAASLTGATTVYNVDGQAYAPTNNDYAIVIADETAPDPFTNQQARWKFIVDSWTYEYSYNTVFTSNQQQAIDSGITEELVDKINYSIIVANGETQIYPYGNDVSINSNYSIVYSNDGLNTIKPGDIVFTKAGQELRVKTVDDTTTPQSFTAVVVSANTVSSSRTTFNIQFNTDVLVGENFFQRIGYGAPLKAGDILVDTDNSIAVVKEYDFNSKLVELFLIYRNKIQVQYVNTFDEFLNITGSDSFGGEHLTVVAKQPLIIDQYGIYEMSYRQEGFGVTLYGDIHITYSSVPTGQSIGFEFNGGEYTFMGGIWGMTDDPLIFQSINITDYAFEPTIININSISGLWNFGNKYKSIPITINIKNPSESFDYHPPLGQPNVFINATQRRYNAGTGIMFTKPTGNVGNIDVNIKTFSLFEETSEFGNLVYGTDANGVLDFYPKETSQIMTSDPLTYRITDMFNFPSNAEFIAMLYKSENPNIHSDMIRIFAQDTSGITSDLQITALPGYGAQLVSPFPGVTVTDTGTVDSEGKKIWDKTDWVIEVSEETSSSPTVISVPKECNKVDLFYFRTKEHE